jgi:hypothetical protein
MRLAASRRRFREMCDMMPLQMGMAGENSSNAGQSRQPLIVSNDTLASGKV